MVAEGGAHQCAAVILGSAEHVSKASGIEVPEAQRNQHELSIALALDGPRQRPYDEAFQRDLTMTIGDAVAFAVEDRLPSPATIAVQPETEIRLAKRELEIARLIAHEMTSRRHAQRPSTR